MRARFEPEKRLKKRSDFLRVQGSKSKIRSKFFVLAISKREEPALKTRLGITITTKIDKRATRRNRLRRQIRELFRQNFDILPPGLDLVVIALNGALELDFEGLRRELCFILEKSKKTLTKI